MRILIAAVELAPIAPAGGVAQYTMGLARALRAKGHDVHVAIPDYGFLPPAMPAVLDGITVHPVGDHDHFRSVRDARGIYVTGGDFLPWAAFSGAVTTLAASLNPQVVHCQDAHTSLVPVMIAAGRQATPGSFAGTGTVITIHNLLEQGRVTRAVFDRLQLPPGFFEKYFEFFGQANCLKAGLLLADRVATVSRTYAYEIGVSDEFVFGLAGVLRSLPSPVAGIVNGIDAESWKFADARYDGTDDVDALIVRKQTALADILPIWAEDPTGPIVAFKARWDHQKGILLLAEGMSEILESTRVIFDTWPEPVAGGDHFAAWRTLASLRDRYPLRLALNVPRTTSPVESAALYTAADFLIMPSVYEPCGLAQMECQRYGCIPIVRRTGGLADTVSDVNAGTGKANGIVFDTLLKEAVVASVKRAIAVHADPVIRKSLITNALMQHNEWDTRMDAYESLYQSVIPGSLAG
jgi:starch synthase